MVTETDIRTGLEELGLRSGDTVVVHSSLSSFGQVEGGAQIVVDALLDVLGDEGTLVFPTFNYQPDVFDPDDTPSVTGAISETVRKRPDAVRSLHPTHSVAAIGRLAQVITEGHERTEPFGRGSALFKVLQAGGKILHLGTTHTTNSMIHVGEELANVPYLERTRLVGIRTAQGKVVRKWIRRPGCSRGFDAIEETLQEKEAIDETTIGNCHARLMSARSVIDAVLELLEFDQEALLCDEPDCEVCAESRAMAAATESERQEREITELAEEEEQLRRSLEKRFEGSPVTYFEPEQNHSSPN